MLLVYAQAVIFSCLNVFSNSFITGVERKFPTLYWANVGFWYKPFIILYFIILTYAFYELILAYRVSSGNKKTQVGYFLLGMLVGFSGGLTNFLPCYSTAVYPVGNFTIPIYCLVVTYAILRYRLLDISIAVTRTGIFIAVYSLVLGIPFALAFGWHEKLNALLGSNWWMVPLVSSTILATAGPFIYLYIQKKAENRLLQEQKRYQATLRQASLGMGRIKDLKKLMNLIVYIVTRTVHLEHSSIYLFDDFEKKYFIEASRNRNKPKTNGAIEYTSPLTRYLYKIKEPIVYEEIKQRTQDYQDKELVLVESALRELDAAVVVPSFIEQKLLAIVVLGRKLSGKLYSEDDLAVFSILANQAALAIENAQFYEDVKRTQEQLFQAEKMATIGTMADGLSHQINNRLHALGFIAGDALDSIKLKGGTVVSPEAKELIDEIQRALVRIQDNVKQGGEVVQGLLKYTRKGEAGFGPVDFDQLVNASIDMAQYKVKLEQITIIKDYSAQAVPKIYGNFTQLQEVFFNLIDNAHDALMQRKNEKNEPNYKPTLRIAAEKKEEIIQISVLDNGIGVKEEDQNKIFTPFFTTKLSSKKGTGLGLYVIQKIIEENHKGKVTMSSEYMTGTLITIILPIVS